jgi:hypothetical protein
MIKFYLHNVWLTKVCKKNIFFIGVSAHNLFGVSTHKLLGVSTHNNFYAPTEEPNLIGDANRACCMILVNVNK